MKTRLMSNINRQIVGENVSEKMRTDQVGRVANVQRSKK